MKMVLQWNKMTKFKNFSHLQVIIVMRHFKIKVISKFFFLSKNFKKKKKIPILLNIFIIKKDKLLALKMKI